MLHSPQERRWFFWYGVIGAIGVLVYLATVWVLARFGTPPIPATMVGYFLGATLQFVLNRNLNFRAFNRPVHSQAKTYLLVMAFNFALTVAAVSLEVRAFHVDTLAANLFQLPISFPAAYLANRFLTFRPSQGRGRDTGPANDAR